MPAVQSEKPHAPTSKDGFAVRGLRFCGLMNGNKRASLPVATSSPTKTHHRSSSNPEQALLKPLPVDLPKTTLHALQLDNNDPLTPPPAYMAVRRPSSSSSQSSISGSTSDDDSVAIEKRRRRLSKTRPTHSNWDKEYSISSARSPTSFRNPTSPLAKSASMSSPSLLPSSSVVLPSSPTCLSSESSTSTEPTAPIPPRPTRTHPPPSSKPKDPKLVDSNGRSKPPISGRPSASNQHTYFYKRARTASTADASRRTQEAVLCLTALLDACDNNDAERGAEATRELNMAHIMEQVRIARGILVGDDDGIGLSSSKSQKSKGKGKGSSGEETEVEIENTGFGRMRSASVTSLATLANLVL